MIERTKKTTPPRGGDQAPFVSNKLIVKLKPGALREAANVFSNRRGVRSADQVRRVSEQLLGPLEMLTNNAGLSEIAPLFAASSVSSKTSGSPGLLREVRSLTSSIQRNSNPKLFGYNMLKLNRDVSKEELRKLKDSQAIEVVERVPNRWISVKLSDVLTAHPSQWGLDAIGWSAIKERPNASRVHVAMLDTGVDVTHQDLAGVIESYDHGSHSDKDLPGHGTHVAGIIAARARRGAGVAGVANCKLHVWKVFDDPSPRRPKERFDDDAYFNALGQILGSPSKILNISLGGTERSQAEQDVFKALADSGCLVVAAMGNSYTDGNPIEFPAAYDDVLAVGALDERLEHAWFSSTGPHIGLVAPGESIYSTVPKYRFGPREVEYASWCERRSGTALIWM